MQGLVGSNDAKQYKKQPYKMPDEPILDYSKNSLNNMEKLPDIEKIPDLESKSGLVDKRKLKSSPQKEIVDTPDEMLASVDRKKQSGSKKKKPSKKISNTEVDDSDADIKNLVDEASEL